MHRLLIVLPDNLQFFRIGIVNNILLPLGSRPCPTTSVFAMADSFSQLRFQLQAMHLGEDSTRKGSEEPLTDAYLLDHVAQSQEAPAGDD